MDYQRDIHMTNEYTLGRGGEREGYGLEGADTFPSVMGQVS